MKMSQIITLSSTCDTELASKTQKSLADITSSDPSNRSLAAHLHAMTFKSACPLEFVVFFFVFFYMHGMSSITIFHDLLSPPPTLIHHKSLEGPIDWTEARGVCADACCRVDV